MQTDSGPVVYCADPDRPTSLLPVPGVEAAWGYSELSPTPVWHFRGMTVRRPTDDRLPSPTEKEMMRAFATMGALAGFPDTLIPKEGTSDTRVPVGVPWVSGMSAPFLRPLEEWWSTNATASSSRTSFRAKAAASRHPVVQHLLFPSPLSTPPAEKRKTFAKDRQAACEAFL